MLKFLLLTLFAVACARHVSHHKKKHFTLNDLEDFIINYHNYRVEEEADEKAKENWIEDIPDYKYKNILTENQQNAEVDDDFPSDIFGELDSTGTTNPPSVTNTPSPSTTPVAPKPSPTALSHQQLYEMVKELQDKERKGEMYVQKLFSEISTLKQEFKDLKEDVAYLKEKEGGRNQFAKILAKFMGGNKLGGGIPYGEILKKLFGKEKEKKTVNEVDGGNPLGSFLGSSLGLGGDNDIGKIIKHLGKKKDIKQ